MCQSRGRVYYTRPLTFPGANHHDHEFILRWFHVLFGIVWIGMLYYFNFVQTEYFKEAEAAPRPTRIKKLAPRALKWFRYGAMVTFLTGAWACCISPRRHGQSRRQFPDLDGCPDGHASCSSTCGW
jgi:uncharacterized membrane protein